MKDLVLHDIKRYLYPDEIRKQVKACATSFHKHTFVVIRDDEEQTLYHLLGEDIKHILQIEATQEVISMISNSLHQSKIVMVTGAELIFYDYKTMDTVKFDFNKQILAANVFLLNSLIAVVSTTEVILYSVQAGVGQLEFIGSNPHSEKPEESVSVQWGSTDPQLQAPSSKRVVPAACKYVSDDWKPQVSWRADGNMFAVNMYDNGNRIVKIFDNTCKLLYITSFPGLESLVVFRPIANMLTTIRTSNGLNQIVTLSETNGKISTSFELEDARKVIAAKWSLCGTALAVARFYNEEDEPGKVCLDVFLESNSEWACKQRLQFDTEKWCGFEWVHSLKSFYKLKIYSSDGIFKYQFVSKIVKCSHPYNSYGISATTLGSRVQFHYFVHDGIEDYDRFASTYTIKMDNQISYLAFDHYNYVVVLIDCKYNGKLYNYINRFDWELLGEFTMPNFNDLIPLCYRIFIINDAFDIFAITYSPEPKDLDVLYRYRLTNNCLDFINNKYIQDGVFSITHTINQKFKADLVFFDHKDGALPITDAFAYRKGKKIIKISLNSSGQLSVNGVQLKAFVTSMYYDADNLILTVPKEIGQGDNFDYLIAMKLNDVNIKRLMDEVDPFSFAYSRRIKQGAVCVNLIHNSASLVLLMPRGDTEVIKVRSITIETLCVLIKSLKYKLAYQFINHYGMGFNMLVDVNPQQFLDNAGHVYAELKEFDVFPEILMDLEEPRYQYKEGMYVFNFPNINNKIKLVCEALITCCCQEKLVNTNARAVTLLCLFSTYPIYNVAKAIEFLSPYVYGTYISCAKVPIKAMSEYVSYEDMFSSALSVNNLDLADLILTMSDMDTSHHKAFTNSLRIEDHNMQRFLICKYLNNYKLATVYLCHIHENNKEEFADKTNDLVKYAKENGTINIAYQTLEANDKCMEELALLYASELDNHNNYLESGMVLYRHGHFVEAFDAFAKGHHFDEALASIKAMDMSQPEKNAKLHFLTRVMIKAGELAKAGHTYLMELENNLKAIMCFLEARQYLTVYNMAREFPVGKYIIEISLIPTMLDDCETICQKLVEDKKSFESFYGRLIQIQAERISDKCDKNRIILRDPKESLPTNDDVDAESVSPVRTSSSARSYGSSAYSGLRRKEESELTSLRVGGAYEDIAIIVKLHEMAVDVFSMHQEIKKLFAAFYCIMPSKQDHYLKVINVQLLDYQNFIISHAESIWRKEYTDITAVRAAIAVCPNLNLLAPMYRLAPPIIKIVWQSSIAQETVHDPFY